MHLGIKDNSRYNVNSEDFLYFLFAQVDIHCAASASSCPQSIIYLISQLFLMRLLPCITDDSTASSSPRLLFLRFHTNNWALSSCARTRCHHLMPPKTRCLCLHPTSALIGSCAVVHSMRAPLEAQPLRQPLASRGKPWQGGARRAKGARHC